jgi:hypothetical protein
MKTFSIGLLICVIAGCRVEGHYVAPDSPPPGDVLWAKQIGGSETDRGRGIAIDSKRNLIAVGSFRQTLNLSAELTSSGEDDLYVVKLDSSTGDVIWVKRVGGKLWDGVFGVAVDASDNIYIGGYFAGSIDFEGETLTTTRESSAFVLKLDPDGGFGWARKIDGSGLPGPAARIMPGAIVTDGNSVVVVNNYTDSLTVDATTLTSAGGFDMFALKMLTSTGEPLWIKSFGGAKEDFATSLAFDKSGNIVISGVFYGTIDFGGGPFSSPNDSGFLLKLASADGSHLVSKQFESTIAAIGSAIIVDSANNILITGFFFGTVDLGCAEKLSSSQERQYDAFLAKYTQTGACIWARGIGGTSGSREAAAIALSSSDDATIAGNFCGSISFDNEILSSASACSMLDGFAAHFSSTGKYLGSIRFGGTSDDQSTGMVQGNDGRLFMTGHFGSLSEFDRNLLTAIGDSDAFIVGFTPLLRPMNE